MKKQKIQFIARIMAIIIIAVPAMAQEVMMITKTNSAYDPSIAFPRSGVFDFIGEAPSLPDHPRLNKVALEIRLRVAVKDTLTNKGYVYQADEIAKVRFFVRISASLDGVTSLPYVSSVDDRKPQPWLDDLYHDQGFKKAVLVVDIVHPVSRKLMWRGVGEAILLFSNEISEEARLRRTTKLVQKILEPFPPPSAQSMD